jgi:hypothetical protein
MLISFCLFFNVTLFLIIIVVATLSCRYFMKELLSKGAIQKAHLPMYLGASIDKAFAQCMYTASQIRAWSLPHLKGGGWYLDCGKGFCPIEEEDDKAAIDVVDALASGPLDSHEDLVDLSLLDDKETEKLVVRKKEVDKVALKKQKEEDKEKEKKKKAEEKAKKAQDKSVEKTSAMVGKSLNTLEVIFGASPSSQLCKCDATLVRLSILTLQYGTSPLAGMSTSASTIVDEFFQGSLLTLAAHFNKHSNFPKEWSDLQALLEHVSSFNNLIL